MINRNFPNTCFCTLDHVAKLIIIPCRIHGRSNFMEVIAHNRANQEELEPDEVKRADKVRQIKEATRR